MDIESRSQKMEAEVHETRILVWVVLALVLAFGLGLLPGYLPLIFIVFTLGAMVYLVVSAISGLRQFRTSREADAQVQDRLLREIIAEGAKTRCQDPNP
jgi:threonine/homoserine/homoserine lactone efflux protein